MNSVTHLLNFRQTQYCQWMYNTHSQTSLSLVFHTHAQKSLRSTTQHFKHFETQAFFVICALVTTVNEDTHNNGPVSYLKWKESLFICMPFDFLDNRSSG